MKCMLLIRSQVLECRRNWLDCMPLKIFANYRDWHGADVAFFSRNKTKTTASPTGTIDLEKHLPRFDVWMKTQGVSLPIKIDAHFCNLKPMKQWRMWRFPVSNNGQEKRTIQWVRQQLPVRIECSVEPAHFLKKPKGIRFEIVIVYNICPGFFARIEHTRAHLRKKPVTVII